MLEEHHQQLLAAAARLVAAGVVSASGHGNLSARLGPDRMVLAAGASLRDLAAKDLGAIGLDGSDAEVELDPSAREIVPMHAEVYRARADIGAIVHTHSPFATAFAVAGHPIACRYEALLRFGQATDVPVVPWAPRGSPESVQGILDTLDQVPETRAVLLGNHGLLVFGPDVPSAVDLLIAVEEGAGAEWRAAALGGSKPLPAGALDAVRASMAAAR
jgi:L-ribulose-5-phosphate 4-epimerase